jgi:hypothetical protein
MIGEMIQEYLVGLGVRLDKPGFGQAEATINSLDRTVETATGHMAANFVRASAMISTAIAGVTASAFGLMKSAASQDLAMQKLSRQMMVGKDAAWTMKAATDALGESIQDIMLTPELMERFNKLTADGQRMKVGGDFEATMKGFRDLMFEFTRLKQEVSYAMTWVGYYLMKYLNRPLAEAREKFRSFNDMFVKNMSVWTEKAARMLVYIINIGKHFLMLVLSVGKALWRMWESFPKGVKIATAALAGLALVMKANPLTRMMLLVSTLLLLIDDYYGHMEGKQSAFGEYWDKLNEYIETAKKKWEEFSGAVSDFFDRVQGSSALNGFIAEVRDLGSAIWELAETYAAAWVEEAKELYASMEKHGAVDGLSGAIGKLWGMFESLLGTVKDFFRWWKRLLGEVRRTKEYHDLIDAVGELAGALTETFNVILDLINIAFSGLFGEIGKTDHVYSFRDAIRAVFSIFTALLRVVTGAVKVFNELLTMMRDSSPFRRFWEELGRMIDRAIEKAGKFGRALIALKNGDFKGAWEIISGDGDGSPAGKGDRDWNRKVAYQRFKAAGYSDEAIAGILGRMQQEHNFDTSDVPEHYVPGIGTVGGYGMYQLNGGRTQRFLAWAEEHGLDPQDPGVQTDFAIIEARERGLGPEYMNQLSPSEATTVWTDKYEVGKHGDEQAYTAEQYADIQSGRILEAQPTQPVSAPADASSAAGNMTYKLERPHYRATPVSTFAAPSYSIDPLLYTGLMTGARQTGYGGYQPTGSGNGSVVYQVNVGGVTVNGTNQNAAEIGRSVGRETMTQLEQKGAHILRSRTMTGAPVLV